MIILFLATFVWVVNRVTKNDPLAPNLPGLHNDAQDSKDSEFITMDQQLVIVKEKRQVIVQVRLKNTPEPIAGSWTVKEVGIDVVLLDSKDGLWTVRMDAIVSIQTIKPSAEQIEK